jgi:hypothetical protein
MSEERAFHYVCTQDEARALIANEPSFSISNCGCREGRGHCDRSRIDVCLQFRGDASAPTEGRHQVTRSQVEDLLREAAARHLVARPYRDAETRTQTHGICFCCDDCCGYFLDPEERCDKGTMIEATNFEACDDCLACVDQFYFHTRRGEAGTLQVASDQCYGCGLCVESCPLDCISLVPRVA